MGFILTLMLVIFVGGPLARGLAVRLSNPAGLPASEARELIARLQDSEARLAAGEERIASLEERLDFYERLLGEAENRARIRGGLSGSSAGS